MTIENRNSGAVIHTDIVLKVCEGADVQAKFMQEHKDVFCDVVKYGVDYYITPCKIQFSRTTPVAVVDSALSKLKVLWGAMRRADKYSMRMSREKYYQYCMDKLPQQHKIVDTFQKAYRKVVADDFIHYQVEDVHGDATLQNIVWDGGTYEAFWIDPNVREVPKECYLDYGKLLQSLEGYDAFTLNQARPIVRAFSSMRREELHLIGFYMLSHLIRLYAYQDVNTRCWAATVAEAYDGRLYNTHI